MAQDANQGPSRRRIPEGSSPQSSSSSPSEHVSATFDSIIFQEGASSLFRSRPRSGSGTCGSTGSGSHRKGRKKEDTRASVRSYPGSVEEVTPLTTLDSEEKQQLYTSGPVASCSDDGSNHGGEGTNGEIVSLRREKRRIRLPWPGGTEGRRARSEDRVISPQRWSPPRPLNAPADLPADLEGHVISPPASPSRKSLIHRLLGSPKSGRSSRSPSPIPSPITGPTPLILRDNTDCSSKKENKNKESECKDSRDCKSQDAFSDNSRQKLNKSGKRTTSPKAEPEVTAAPVVHRSRKVFRLPWPHPKVKSTETSVPTTSSSTVNNKPSSVPLTHSDTSKLGNKDSSVDRSDSEHTEPECDSAAAAAAVATTTGASTSSTVTTVTSAVGPSPASVSLDIVAGLPITKPDKADSDTPSPVSPTDTVVYKPPASPTPAVVTASCAATAGSSLTGSGGLKLVPRSPCRINSTEFARSVSHITASAHCAPDITSDLLAPDLIQGETQSDIIALETEKMPQPLQCVASQPQGMQNAQNETMSTQQKGAVNRVVSVQEWVNSLHSQQSMDEGMGEGGGEKAPVVPDDELFLGAEAKSIGSDVSPKPVLTNGNHGNQHLGPHGNTPQVSSRQDWRARFAMTQQSSFNSEQSARSDSSKSIDQILRERAGDPEKILTNLGFCNPRTSMSVADRLPTRFLHHDSKAEGINRDSVLHIYPELRETLAMSAPYGNMAPVTSESDSISSDAGHASFSTLAGRVAMMKRFISKERRAMLARFEGVPQDEDDRIKAPVLEGLTPKGNQYSSILHPDNTAHLAVQGVYDANIRSWKGRNNTGEGAVKEGGLAGVVKSALKRQDTLQSLGVETLDESDLYQNTPRRKLSPIPYAVSPLDVSDSADKEPTSEARIPPSDEKCDDLAVFTSGASGPDVMTSPEKPDITGFNVETDTTPANDDVNINAQNHDVKLEQNNNVVQVCDDAQQDVPNSSDNDLGASNEVHDLQDAKEDFSSHTEVTPRSYASGRNAPTTRKISLSEIRRQMSVDISDTKAPTQPEVPIGNVDESPTNALIIPKVTIEEVTDHSVIEENETDLVNSEVLTDDAPVPCKESSETSEGITDPAHDKVPDMEDKLLSAPAVLVKRQKLQDTPALQSFELEEVTSADMVLDDLPTFTQADKQRHLVRTGSAQSDSSGFAEADHIDVGDADWNALKVAHLGSSGESEVHPTQHDVDSVSSQHSQATTMYACSVTRCASGSKTSLDRLESTTSTDTLVPGGSPDHSTLLPSDSDKPEVIDICDDITVRHVALTEEELSEVKDKLRDLQANAEVTASSASPTTSTATSACVFRASLFPSTPLSESSPATSTPNSAAPDPLASPGERGGETDPAVLELGIREEEPDEDTPQPELDETPLWKFGPDLGPHRILCTLIKQQIHVNRHLQDLSSMSVTWKPSPARIQQHLLEEVKLMQHAVQKFKMELDHLQKYTDSLYNSAKEEMTPEDAESLKDMRSLREEVQSEITSLQHSLALRTRAIIAGDYTDDSSCPIDMAAIKVIQQMVEILKEQVYHGSIVQSLSPPSVPISPAVVPVSPAVVSMSPAVVPVSSPGVADSPALSANSISPPSSPQSATESLLSSQLQAIQEQLASQQMAATASLQSTLAEMRTMLVEEVRKGIQRETQKLRLQAQIAESQILALRRRTPAPPERPLSEVIGNHGDPSSPELPRSKGVENLATDSNSNQETVTNGNGHRGSPIETSL